MNQGLQSYSLDRRIAVVTGAARGIGEAISLRLAQMGAHVVLADLDGKAEAAAQRLRESGHSAEDASVDVTDTASVDALAKKIRTDRGRVDIVVANAGIAYESSTAGHSDEEWRRVMSINLDGVFRTIRAFGDIMLEQKAGSIVAISSIAGVKAVRPERHAGYDVAKAGVAHFCKVVGVEWARQGVRVNAVGPGYTDTQMLRQVGIEQPEVMAQWMADTPVQRLMQPTEIANAVAFLASDAASGITAQLLMVDGGYSAA